MIFVNKYKQEELLGGGTFGIIFKVSEIATNNYYALKFITISQKTDEEKKKIEEDCKNEYSVMKNIKNKYIIELKDYFFDNINKGYYIVMELCDEDLRKILNKYKPKGLPLNIIKKIFIQLNEALKTMRENGLIHRDLKPENILIKYSDTNKTDFHIKLIDFGLTSYNINSIVQTQSKAAGTQIYMAPEVESLKYNNKCDLWSLGIILYELYTNKYIFDSDESRKKGKIIKETDNEIINELIRKLININIEKRIEWEDYFNEEFLKFIKKEKNMMIMEN